VLQVTAAADAAHAGDVVDASSNINPTVGTNNSALCASFPLKRNRQRDWQILLGFKAGLEAPAILSVLRELNLLGDEPCPWSAVRVITQHKKKVSALLLVQDLMGLDEPMHTLHTLFEMSG
jgi:hypothetical protein